MWPNEKYVKKQRRWYIVHNAPLKFHVASAHFAEHMQSVLITGILNHCLDSLGSKGLLQPTIFWRNPSLTNLHPHRICNYRTLQISTGLFAEKLKNLLEWTYPTEWKYLKLPYKASIFFQDVKLLVNAMTYLFFYWRPLPIRKQLR